MKKGSCFIIILLFMIVILIGCGREEDPQQQEAIESALERLEEVEAVADIGRITGVRVEEGIFYFTGVEENYFNFYALDLADFELTLIHERIGRYDSFIPIKKNEALLVDSEGQLLHRSGVEDKKIDEEITFTRSPNVRISPDESLVLYTKGPTENAHLYLYNIQENNRILVKDSMSEEEVKTFSYKTRWSPLGNYFVVNHNQIYDIEGNLYYEVDATTTNWGPNDEHLVFIKMPDNPIEEVIFTSHWESYIGYEMVLLSLESKEEKTIFTRPEGMVDVFENIQWSQEGSRVGISVGEIIQGSEGQLEKLNYEKVMIYNIEQKEATNVRNMPYNFFDFLSEKYIYGSNLGVRDVLDIIELETNERKTYSHPDILNNRDMFAIVEGSIAYIIEENQLLKVSFDDSEDIMSEEIIYFPWDVMTLYKDEKTARFVVITNENNVFVFDEN
ncbi:hypothetical protein RH915_09120 [Serpentinicella sp. ANB-PHB4]|uniref:hypothetical protein n=1 Tax=Serpentinicella sp. ANB-PHB4 TaxID=3074076 RepID=UPI002863FF24|nr:hypothetical protein [Serpentinicella sp. ANB-PHB4]MDR5659655.1 hypothetical protein [Serpentinicella sp. ANB-PHB4]